MKVKKFNEINEELDVSNVLGDAWDYFRNKRKGIDEEFGQEILEAAKEIDTGKVSKSDKSYYFQSGDLYIRAKASSKFPIGEAISDIKYNFKIEVGPIPVESGSPYELDVSRKLAKEIFKILEEKWEASQKDKKRETIGSYRKRLKREK